MEAAYLATTGAALEHFQVTESGGLSDAQVKDLTAKHGLNSMRLLCLISEGLAR